jgi:O-antigen ligase
MLSGRLPLWQTLLPHAAERLWTGHGFGAFWTPDRFSEVYAAVRWSAVVAHNGFLEELLATGLVGLLLLLAFWTYGMYLSWQLGPSGYLVFSWLALFLYFNAMATIIESYYQFPTFVSFAALALVAFETSCRRCQNCSVMLLEEDTASGEPLLIHP